jgi:hypothetical protein
MCVVMAFNVYNSNLIINNKTYIYRVLFLEDKSKIRLEKNVKVHVN